MKVLDMSFAQLTLEKAHGLRRLGFEGIAQCLWADGSAQPAHRVTNLRNTVAAGMFPFGYTVLRGWNSGRWHVDQARAGFPDDLWDRLLFNAVDFETRDVNYTQVVSALARSAALGSRFPVIYTAYNPWVNYLGNPPAPNGSYLWKADWDGTPNDHDRLYGGWTEDRVIGDQWSGQTTILGMAVDQDEFNRKILFPPPPVGDPAQEAALRKVYMAGAEALCRFDKSSLKAVVNMAAYLGCRFGECP